MKATEKNGNRAASAAGGAELLEISLEGMTLETVLGAFPEERSRPRTVVVDALLSARTAAAASDDLRDTVDWAALRDDARRWARSAGFRLVEAFADALAARILAFDPRIAAVSLRVAKPGAFPDEPGLTPSVRLFRRRKPPRADGPRTTERTPPRA